MRSAEFFRTDVAFWMNIRVRADLEAAEIVWLESLARSMAKPIIAKALFSPRRAT